MSSTALNNVISSITPTTVSTVLSNMSTYQQISLFRFVYTYTYN